MLRIAGLRRQFGGVHAVNGVDLDVRSGELHALIGPNGAGKTTLIHLISGALKPDSGQVVFDGDPVDELAMYQRAAGGLVRSFQLTQLFSHLTALENVRLAIQSRPESGSSYRCWRPADADGKMAAEARTLLADVGLAPRANTLAADLAHGEQRALELAMALATRPRLLLLDEPMAGMGADESEQLANLIAGLKGRIALLLVEHDMDIVFRLADRISVLVAGRIVASDVPDAIRTHPEVRRAYLGDEIVALPAAAELEQIHDDAA